MSLDLSDLGIISDISYVLTQISSALPFSQSPSSLRPGHPNGHQLSLNFCFHCSRPSGHMPRSTSPMATTGPEWHNLHAWESKLSRQQILTSGREKAKTEGRYIFSSFLPLMDCSGTIFPSSLSKEVLCDWVVTCWGASSGYSWHFMKQWPVQ